MNEDPITIGGHGDVYPYIVCPNLSMSDGSVFRENHEEVIVNSSNVNRGVSIINTDHEYNDKVYQCYTLGNNTMYGNSNIKAEKDLVLNYILIGSGAPGYTNSDNRSTSIQQDLSSGRGGTAGSVISGRLNMKKGDIIDVNIPMGKQLDTLKYLGKEIDPYEVGEDIRFYNNNIQFASSSSMIGEKWTIVAGGALWPTMNSIDLYQTTLPCIISGLYENDVNYFPSITSDYITEDYTIWRSRPGGYSKRGLGLASGFYDGYATVPPLITIPIMNVSYTLPCGGGGGGNDSEKYYNNFNIPYDYANISFGGCGRGGGGYGSVLTDKRILDAWMPGGGGGGAKYNDTSLFSNGHGGSGCMIFWVEK